MAKRTHTLIIGYGNTLRRDDGAGRALAAKLAEHWRRQGRYVRTLLVQQLTPDLAFDITAEDVGAVIFVDASMAGAGVKPARLKVTIAELQASSQNAGLGHHMDASELMIYAQLLYRRRPAAWLVTVPGVDFAHGELLSQPVQRLLADLPAIVQQLETRINGMFK